MKFVLPTTFKIVFFLLFFAENISAHQKVDAIEVFLSPKILP